MLVWDVLVTPVYPVSKSGSLRVVRIREFQNVLRRRRQHVHYAKSDA